MAKASWLSVNPMSGTGDKVVGVSAPAYTGRTARTTIITFSGANVLSVTRYVKQMGAKEFVSLPQEATATKGTDTLVVTGTSNSPSLTFSAGSIGDMDITVADQYSVGGEIVDNGMAIPGDPGAATEYTFSISVDFTPNDTIEPKTAQLIVRAADGTEKTCQITFAAGDAYLIVEDKEISIDAAGGSATITVNSNIQWTIK